MFKGTYTAIVTPFHRGRVDESALERLIEFQIQGNVDGIVPVGTTGESPTLSMEEHIRVIEITVKVVKGRVKILAGAGANSTDEAIFLSQAAERVGAQGLLHVAPYYNKPSQEGLFQHFQAISKSTELPVVLYSVPSRCGVEIEVETAKRLREVCPNVIGIKEAGGSTDRVTQFRSVMGPEFLILSGDDGLTLPFMALGAHGVISVASNVIPKQVSRMTQAMLKGDLKAALKIHEEFTPLFKALFLESNPTPVKAALAMMGFIQPEYRLPLVRIRPKTAKILKDTLIASGILK